MASNCSVGTEFSSNWADTVTIFKKVSLFLFYFYEFDKTVRTI